MKKIQWVIVGVMLALMGIICTGMVTTNSMYIPAEGYFNYGISYRRVPCELCGEALSVSVPSENNWILCDTTSSLPIADYESSYCVGVWEFNLKHDLCDECALLANEKIKKPLTDKHDELWGNLVKIKAEEKAEREVIRKGLHIKNLKDKIFGLTEQLCELEGKKE